MSASKDSTLKLWNLRTQKLQVDLPGHTDEVFCVDFVADKIASGGRDKTLKMYVLRSAIRPDFALTLSAHPTR